MKPVRFSKIGVLILTSVYMFLVVLNNLTDYNSNFLFVSNVMSMSDVFSTSAPSWRAIEQPLIHHLCYLFIILVELLIAILCALGALTMYRERKGPKTSFDQAIKYGIYGLLLGVFLWYGVFIAVAGEWFLMWQSVDWNGNPTAFRNTIFMMVSLIFLTSVND